MAEKYLNLIFIVLLNIKFQSMKTSQRREFLKKSLPGIDKREFAQHTLFESGLPDNPCGNCSTCMVKCPTGFNVRERLQDISRLKNVPREFIVS